MNKILTQPIKAIIGLGNPGIQYAKTRHNIGFLVVDELASRFGGSWRPQGNFEVADVEINQRPVSLIKPQTSMNLSGQVIPALQKRGIKPENILVIHDELEHPFGKMTFRIGGSHRGHNGLRSLIEYTGPDFARLRFGIGRPEQKEDVPRYVLEKFKEPADSVAQLIDQACQMIEEQLS